MIKLVIEDDEGHQQLVNLDKDELEISIGRKEGSNIRLGERNVSRQHAILSKAEGKVFIEDFSRYGTRVNGKKLAEGERAEITPSDEVVVGDYRMSIQDDAVTAGGAGDQAQSQTIPEREQPKLVVISSNFAGDEFKITKNEIVIGRTPDNDIAIDDRSISRNHAKITRISRGVFQIQDLESANGIKVKNRPVTVFQLSSGDIIELGQVRFRFCEAGENWFFDPERFPIQEAPKLPPPPPPRNNAMIGIIAAVAVIGIVVVVVVATQKEDPKVGGTGGQTGNTNTGPTEVSADENIKALLNSIDGAIESKEYDDAFGSLKNLVRDYEPSKHEAVKREAPDMADKIAAALFSSASSSGDPAAVLAALTKVEDVNAYALKLDPNLEAAKKRSTDIKVEKEYLPKFEKAAADLRAAPTKAPADQRTTCKDVADAAVMIAGSQSVIAKALAQQANLKTQADTCVRNSFTTEIDSLIASKDKNKMSAAKTLVDSYSAAFGSEAGIGDKVAGYKKEIDRIENPPPDEPRDPGPGPGPDPIIPKTTGGDEAKAAALEAEADSLKVSNSSKAIKLYKESLKLKSKDGVWIKLGNLQLVAGLECDAVKSFEKGGDSAGAAKAKAKCQ